MSVIQLQHHDHFIRLIKTWPEASRFSVNLHVHVRAKLSRSRNVKVCILLESRRMKCSNWNYVPKTEDKSFGISFERDLGRKTISLVSKCLELFVNVRAECQPCIGGERWTCKLKGEISILTFVVNKVSSGNKTKRSK